MSSSGIIQGAEELTVEAYPIYWALVELSSILLVSILLLGATALCVMVFERLGFGSVLGFIVAGVLVGPNTPGPVASEHLDELQQVSEMGVVLFLFIVGLEMRPERLWAMRRLPAGITWQLSGHCFSLR